MAGHGRVGVNRMLPERHPTADFFICDIFDALPKNDLASMEHPLFSLSTRPDLRVLTYTHNDVTVIVTPSVRGRATLFDKDILIYCISQLMAALNAGKPVNRTMYLRAYDLLVATNRETSGDGYRRLIDAFERLAGTRITTNIATGEIEQTTGFGLIETWQVQRKTRGGRMVSVRLTLAEWLFRAVMAKSVLTLSRDYFRLRKPLERRIYELVRKHCGHQPEWRISLPVLAHKSGSNSPLRVFRRMMRDMIDSNHLPDYEISETQGDMICFRPRRGLLVSGEGPNLTSDTLEEARQLLPGFDVYALEADWRAWWVKTGCPRLGNPDAAFLGWVRKLRKK